MTAAADVAARREREQRGSVVIRAISGQPTAEIRGGQLLCDDRPVAIASPYLLARGLLTPGRADALALLLAHCDLGLHLGERPAPPLERIIVDILEQIRCESLRPDAMVGMRANLHEAFWEWDAQVRADGMTEARLGIVIYAITHMARSRLVAGLNNEMVEDLLEATWFGLAPLIGVAFGQLKPNRHDQRAYLAAASEVAAIVGELAEQDPDMAPVEIGTDSRYQLLVPPRWLDEDADDHDEDAVDDVMANAGLVVADLDLDERPSLLTAGGYRIYTTEFDVVVDGSDLYPDVVLGRARQELDELVRQQPISIARLARQLGLLFGHVDTDGWEFGLDEGHIDGRRLPQLIARPSEHRVFRWERQALTSDTVISFLVDTSGSMKRQRYQAVATLIDTWVRALDLAGIATEVLGYTTAAWTGGRARTQWIAAGAPPEPGRLNEAQHIIYKSADRRWRRARRSLAATMRTPHYREGLDGEALSWAWERLVVRPERRRILVVISDGSPMDSATTEVNPTGYLDNHLASVARHIERDPRVALGSIGIALDTSPWFRNSVALDLDDVMTTSTYQALHALFGGMSVR